MQGEGNREFCFELTTFERPVRHPEAWGKAVAYKCVGFSGGRPRNTHWGFLSVGMVFKDMRPDKIPEGTNIEIFKRRGK